jgi:signal transduction histidine kinase
VDSVIDSTRRISRDLRPAVLDCGIVAAIRWQAEEFTKHCGIPCDALTRREEIILDPDRSVAVFRMFQETLSNIVRHARASRVQVSVDEIEGWLRVEVTDDGCGISEDDLAKPDSFGLRGIRERCRDLGGEMRIACDPAGGTRITVEVPLQPKEIGGPDPAPPGPIMPATGRPAAHSRFRDRTTKDKVRQPRGYANDTSADCG